MRWTRCIPVFFPIVNNQVTSVGWNESGISMTTRLFNRVCGTLVCCACFSYYFFHKLLFQNLVLFFYTTISFYFFLRINLTSTINGNNNSLYQVTLYFSKQFPVILNLIAIYSLKKKTFYSKRNYSVK